MIKKLGVLTGGGDCPGLNAVIRAVVKTAYYQGIKVFGLYGGFSGFIEEDKMKELHPKDVKGILVTGGTILGTYNKGSLLQKGRFEKLSKIQQKKEIERHLRVFDKNKIDALIAIGGDGTLSIAHVLSEHGLKVVGVPKTIDNDVIGTEVTFGFDTAVATATDALDKLHSTAQSHERIMVVELMGRYAGWIALHSGISGGADVILIPEIPFCIDAVCKSIMERYKNKRKFAIVVVAEGAMPYGKNMFVKDTGDGVKEPVLGGIGNFVSNEIGRITGHESRSLVLGHLQRGGSPTTYDRLLSTRFGTAAVLAVKKREFGKMVAIHSNKINLVPLDRAFAGIRKIDPNSEILEAARELGISLGERQRSKK